MARNRPEKADKGHQEPEAGHDGGGVPEGPPAAVVSEVPEDMVLKDMSPVLPAAAAPVEERDVAAERAAVKTKVWRVTRGGRVHLKQGFTRIHEGKRITSAGGYDVEELKRQGIVLEYVGEE